MGSDYRKSDEAVLQGPADIYVRSPSWEGAYKLYRPLLFGALSKLAKTGFPVAPTEGLDLIHDFFIDGWDGVRSNYDPSRAKFATYLYRSFVNFARPRIVKAARWRDTLLTPEELSREIETREEHPSRDDDPVNPFDVDRVRSALGELPALDRELLLCYLEGRETSERKLANRFSLTRYALRLRLSDALAKIAVKIGERGSLSDPEWRFALALWRDKRTIRETALLFKRPVGEIQEMRMNIFRNLSRSIYEASDMGSKPVSGSYEQARILLEAALRRDARPEAFEALRKHSALVLEYLDQPSADASLQVYEAHLNADKLSALYAALGAEEVLDEVEVDIQSALFEASEMEDINIGNAFRDVLVPTLPAHLTDFTGRIFLGAPKVDNEVYESLLADISVQQGGPLAADLAVFGITPVTILVGSQGIADLARRFCNTEEIQRGQTLVLDRGGTRTLSGALPILGREVSIREVMLVTELLPPTSDKLFDWLATVSSYINQLFSGFYAELWGDELRLQRTDEIVEDLFERWFSPPETRAVA